MYIPAIPPNIENFDVKLVITSEGNGSFYEGGMFSRVTEDGYPALGYNHPGYGCSTGTPYQKTVMSAAVSVLQFANNVLQIPNENIVGYGWSIGCFNLLTTAVLNPNLLGIILDATFDHIPSLAKHLMPDYLRYYANEITNDYWRLPNIDLIDKYPGPIVIIRRLRDNMMNTDSLRSPKSASNRSNVLIEKLFETRYKLYIDRSSMDAWLYFRRDRTHVMNEVNYSENTGRLLYEEIRTRTEINISQKEKVLITLYLLQLHLVELDVDHAESVQYPFVNLVKLLAKQKFHIKAL